MKSGTGCHFLEGLVTARGDQADLAAEILGTTPLDTGGVYEILHDPETDESPDDEVLQHIVELVAVFRVKDPAESVAQLEGGGVRGSVIHGIGHLNHISYMPGADHQPANVTKVPELADSSPNRIVAVVDSGVTENLPAWLESGLRFDPFDVEVLADPAKDASHGTFVAGLIRRIAPEHTISMARPAKVDISRFNPKRAPGHKDADDMTSELHVMEAIIRLLHRHHGNLGAVEALNLSLGGVTCDKTDSWMLVLSQAIDFWRRHLSRCVPIFAAGGNTPDPRPVFPGAFGHVRSVAAAEEGGRQVVWDQGMAVDPPSRPWIDDVAPGVDLVSTGGGTKDEWVSWSGSSFATAVAAACYVSRRPMEAFDGLVWWKNHHVRYSDIPGLVI